MFQTFILSILIFYKLYIKKFICNFNYVILFLSIDEMYHSEKINWLEDTVEPLQILKRPTKQPEAIGLIAPLKRAIFRHPVEQQDPFDVVETLWRTPTNMTFGQLLQDDTYRAEMMKALEVEKVQTLTP